MTSEDEALDALLGKCKEASEYFVQLKVTMEKLGGCSEELDNLGEWYALLYDYSTAITMARQMKVLSDKEVELIDETCTWFCVRWVALGQTFAGYGYYY